MKRVLILVEGQTEERFVKDVLQPHFWACGVHPEPTIVTTRRTAAGRSFKGGNSFAHVEADLRRLLGDSGTALVTTLLDYYGLPENFPGMMDCTETTALRRVRHLQAALEAHLRAGPRFRAFFLLHEFEALLFADPVTLSKTLNEPSHEVRIREVRTQFPSVEDINDGPTTAPSKRLATLFPAYRKTLHGPLVTARTGVTVLRSASPHFSNWLAHLEGLGSNPPATSTP